MFLGRLECRLNMADIDQKAYLRMENAVLAFVRDHPDLTRDEIQKRLFDIKPNIVRIALFHLTKKALVEGYFERHADGRMEQHFRPAKLDRK